MFFVKTIILHTFIFFGQALNQLFEKIIALDIDERHLLRLGHGEESLETEKDFSRLENRRQSPRFVWHCSLSYAKTFSGQPLQAVCP